MTQMRIGYIGLGTMGAPMAMNILKAGFPLTVFNRTPSKATDLIAAGARWADTPGEVASRTEVVFTNLSDTPDVLHVLFGPNGVIEGSHPGMILVDNSTIKPSASREIYHRFHEVGVSTLDAPVSGGDIGARNGTLAIMVGGEAEAHIRHNGLVGRKRRYPGVSKFMRQPWSACGRAFQPAASLPVHFRAHGKQLFYKSS